MKEKMTNILLGIVGVPLAILGVSIIIFMVYGIRYCITLGIPLF